MRDQIDEPAFDAGQPEFGSQPLFSSEGKVGELYKIFIPNLIFTVLTFGLFRFWAKTRNRRYILSRMKVLGDSFEYTGTGGELFKGFLIVFFLIILPFGILPAYYVQGIALQDPALAGLIQGGQALFFVMLFPVAIYRSYKYLISRITWRGIEFALVGATLGYWGRWLGYMLLLPVTLGLIYPQMKVALTRYVVNNMRFGSQKISMEASVKPLYVSFLISFVLMLGAAGISALFVMSGFDVISSGYPGSVDELPPHIQVMIVGIFVGGLVLWAVLSGLAFSFYQAKFISHLVSGTQVGECRLKMQIGAWQLLKFAFVNFLIALFTLGLGYPIIACRYMRFIAQHVQAANLPSLEQTIQVERDKLSAGEGLADALDLGAF